tara:strand:+ start:1555 stop:1914 length:360 start_codon:yes stop_codon:yes gene_type:complete
MKNTLNNSSYADYLKDQLALMSSNFTIKVYKRANEDEWGGFIKGKDLRVQIQHKKKFLFEFLVESSFWHQRNVKKEDRIYMRRWADPKLQMIMNTKIKQKKKNNSVCQTQDAFEKMKNK